MSILKRRAYGSPLTAGYRFASEYVYVTECSYFCYLPPPRDLPLWQVRCNVAQIHQYFEKNVVALGLHMAHSGYIGGAQNF